MKRIFIALMLVSNVTFGQTDGSYTENLDRDFMEYHDLIVHQELEKSMEFMLPEIFEIIPMDQMLVMMKQVYNNPDMEFRVDRPKDVTYGEPQKIDVKYYSEISYTYDMKIRYLNLEESEEGAEDEMGKEFIKSALELAYGEGNVEYDEETDFYEIHAVKKAYGVSENGTSDWKFVVVEPKQKLMLEKILPKELTKKL